MKIRFLPVVLFVSTAIAFAADPSADKPSAGPKASKTAEPEKKPESPAAKPQKALFDGKTLTGWKANDFAGQGEVSVKNGELRLDMGADLSGVTWTNGPLPKVNYEVELDAMKIDGTDFFCGLSFPVKDSFCSLICGGWGGGVVGISSLDGMDASENDTSRSMFFEKKRWYHIKVRVLENKLEAWIDDQKVIDVNTKGRKISMRPGEIEECKPLGIATWQTSGAFKNIVVREL